MPILQNSRHELFAQAIASGKSASAAYVAAGYPPHGSNAARLSKKEHVATRVDELQRTSAEQAGVTIERIVNGFADIAFSDNAKDADRISALEKLGKHMGMFKDGVQPNVHVTIYGREAAVL